MKKFAFYVLLLLIIMIMAPLQSDGQYQMPYYQQMTIAQSYSQPITVTIGFILPSQSLTDLKTREQLRQFLAVNQEKQQKVSYSLKSNDTNSNQVTNMATPATTRKAPAISYRLRVNPVYTSGTSMVELVQNLFCSRAAEGINALFVLVDKVIQGNDGTRIANFLTTLANAAGLPTLAWSSSANELEDAANNGDRNFRFLLAPPIRSQARALHAFLQTYQWKRFSILASSLTPAHETFVDELRDLANGDDPRYSRFTFDSHQAHMSARVIRIVKFSNSSRENIRGELMDLRDNTDTRIIVLYASHAEANVIFEESRLLGMTSGEYLWVCAKPVLGDGSERVLPTLNFIPGTIAVTYNTSLAMQHEVLKMATKLWADAMERLVSLNNITADRLWPRVACDGSPMKNWNFGESFYNIMKSLPISPLNGVNLNFDRDGLVDVGAMQLLNLDSHRQWKQIGEWTKWSGLHMEDITWPAGPGKPPSGRPDATILKVATLEEPPYVTYESPDPISGVCPRTAVPCRLSPVLVPKQESDNNATLHLVLSGEFGDLRNATYGTTIGAKGVTSYSFVVNPTQHAAIMSSPAANGSWVCCVGFCMDLLRRLSTDIGFRFEVFEVQDRKWGGLDRVTGQWNGLVHVLLEQQADIVVTSLKISRERSTAVDFSIPFLETGITILVRVREGVISPVAFLEPFSAGAWIVVLLGCVNACGMSTFLFEYFSPSGLDRGEASSLLLKAHKFSLFRSLWLVWAMLFKAAVKVDIPRGIGARVMASVWGMFCVIFMSSYMANLAAFMITKEDFHDFSGIDDYRLKNPYSRNPPWKFATIPSGATEAIIKYNFPDMYDYMRPFNRSSADDGMWAVKKGDLDAFLYDATVLEYKAGRDRECRLRTVGKWYAMTGYGIAFPKGSKWLPLINKYIIEYQHTGYLQQLQEFWLTGACKERQKKEKNQSQQLGILNFTSAFIMLSVGLGACLIFLTFEHIYVKYGRRHLRKIDKCGVCGLISLTRCHHSSSNSPTQSMGASLSFKDTVQGALSRLQNEKPCTSNSCQFQHEFLKAQLRRSRNQLRNLESHLSTATNMKRETTFGPDDPSESPIVNFKPPSQAGNGQLIKSFKIDPINKLGNKPPFGPSPGSNRRIIERTPSPTHPDYEPLLSGANSLESETVNSINSDQQHQIVVGDSHLYSQPHPHPYQRHANINNVQCRSLPMSGNSTPNRANINRPLLVVEHESEKNGADYQGDDRLSGNYSIGSYRQLPQSTSATSSNSGGSGNRRPVVNSSTVIMKRDGSQPLTRSVSFGTTTTYIAPSPASTSGEAFAAKVGESEIETNL